jgi:hypothetical protein
MIPLVIVGQNAPTGVDPDGAAFPRNSDAGRRARRLWPIGDRRFDSAVRVNAMPADPARLRSPLRIGTERLGAVLDALHGDVACIIAAGGWAAAVVARVARLDATLAWNVPAVSPLNLRLLAVAHPSGRNRFYNDPAFRRATASAVAELLTGQGYLNGVAGQ